MVYTEAILTKLKDTKAKFVEKFARFMKLALKNDALGGFSDGETFWVNMHVAQRMFGYTFKTLQKNMQQACFEQQTRTYNNAEIRTFRHKTPGAFNADTLQDIMDRKYDYVTFKRGALEVHECTRPAKAARKPSNRLAAINRQVQNIKLSPCSSPRSSYSYSRSSSEEPATPSDSDAASSGDMDETSSTTTASDAVCGDNLLPQTVSSVSFAPVGDNVALLDTYSFSGALEDNMPCNMDADSMESLLAFMSCTGVSAADFLAESCFNNSNNSNNEEITPAAMTSCYNEGCDTAPIPQGFQSECNTLGGDMYLPTPLQTMLEQPNPDLVDTLNDAMSRLPAEGSAYMSGNWVWCHAISPWNKPVVSMRLELPSAVDC